MLESVQRGRGVAAPICSPMGSPIHSAANSVIFEGLEGRRMMANIIPDLSDIANQNVPGRKPLIIPLTASDVDGHKLSYTVKSSNKNVQVYLHKRNNPFIRMHVQGKGVMEFQLLRDVAPKTVDIIKGLIQAEYYDGLTFHRVIKDFMIQGGDQAGTGSGFFPYKHEDEYHPDVVFTGKYQLAMANSGNDTNGSQFFITTSSPRHLDFNHTIFGQLTRGQSVAEAIDDVAVNTSTSKPLSDVVITKIELIENYTDAVLMIKAPAGVTGNVTVTVNDGHGGSDTETFTVTGVADSTNSPPMFIKPIADFVSPVNQTITLDLKALDIEGDVLSFGGSYVGERHFEGTIQGNKIILFPEKDYRGLITIKPLVQQTGNANTDEYTIVIAVGDKPLTAATGTKLSAVSGKQGNFIVGTFKDTDPKSTAKEFAAMIYWGDGTVSTGSISKKSGVYSISGKHQYPSEGAYPVKVAVTSKGGATAYMTSVANVADAPLTGKGVVLAGTAGAAISSSVVLATFTDADPRGKITDFVATIDWGDDTNDSVGTITTSANGGFQVTGPGHTYATGGEKPVRITIQDKGGSKVVVNYNAIIGDGSLVVTADTDATIPENGTYNKNAGFADSEGTSWTGTVDWGDGSPLQDLVIDQENKTFVLNHKYLNSGIYRVTVVIRDQTGLAVNSGSSSYRMTVTNVTPTATITEGQENGVRGQVRTIKFSANDPSPADVAAGIRYQIDWGDNSGVQTLNANATSASHIYTTSGSFTVKLRAIDKDGGIGPEAIKPIIITAAALQPSPEDSTKMDLIVGGTNASEIIKVEPTAVPDEVVVKIGDTEIGKFTPSGRVRVFGGAGNDTITTFNGITQLVELYGETGSDALVGATGNDLLVGGGGDDTLNSGGGDDVLIGGAGKDSLNGGDGEDLLIAAATKFDGSPQKLATLVSEWARNKSYAERVSHILGSRPGGFNAFSLNGKTILKDSDVDTLVGSDGDDLLVSRPKGPGADTLIGRSKREVLFAI